MIQTSAKRQTAAKQDVVSTILLDDEEVRIPGWVRDLESFRRWYYLDEFPESGRICYLNGEVWVDMSREQAFSHNLLKTQFAAVLTLLLQSLRLGIFFGDGMRVTNPAADLSCRPDGVFVAHKSFRSGKVRLVEASEEGFIELEGAPDMALEVVSPSTVHKDTVRLRDLYWKAGIQEYWIADARGERLLFDILQHGSKGYTVTRKQAGWVKSAVFGKSFRLMRRTGELGNPEYTLSVR